MWNLINAPETEIFGIAIALMVLLGALEVISMLAGGISDWLDNLLPDSLTETAHAEVGLDAGVPCRVRTDGLPVSDDLCRRVRQLSERMAGGSSRVVPFAAAGAPDGGRTVQNHAQRRNHRRFAGKLNRTHRHGGAGRSTGRQRGAGAGEGCVWSTALCDGGTGFRRSVETGRRSVAGVAGGEYV